MADRPRVILESPLTGPTEEIREKHRRYLDACLRDSLLRGEAPFASHKLYPGALDDDIPEERDAGIKAGFVWREVTEKTVVYTDCGTSGGMKWGIKHAEELGHPIEYRQLGGEWAEG